jgi:hypothetical protein
MTEVEWLTGADARQMHLVLKDHPRGTPRVWRLFLAAFWRTQQEFIANKRTLAEFLRRVALVEEWGETGVAPSKYYRNVFLHEDVAKAVEGTIRMAVPSEQIWPTAPPRQADALREVFGNPFRVVAVEPEWLTTDVLALARGIYDERAFDRMPILADALQDAGCANEDVLDHCRATAVTHVRGCWVLDGLLGKT